MKVLLINTSERQGGAAVACNRLMKALQKSDVSVKMIVRDKQTDNPDVISVNTSYWKTKINFFRFVWERFVLWGVNGFSRKNLFSVSLANTGIDISRFPEVRDADIIHLHWINQGMLSLKGIRKLLKLGKPIVWTLHDMWEFTAICHYAGSCDGYYRGCGNCPFLVRRGERDLSYKIFRRKRCLFNYRITFVACSNWLAECARKSMLLKDLNVISIPNPINVHIFFPQSKLENKKRFALSENKKTVLFGAAKLSDPRKGFSYFCQAMELLALKYPFLNEEIEIVFLGESDIFLPASIPYQVKKVGYLAKEEDIVALYNASDVFVIPSLEDNLPNTVMEVMACGVPVVGFATGGIPQMVDHLRNGYIADSCSDEDLMTGIYWVLFQANSGDLAECARQKVVNTFSEEIIGDRFYRLYYNILNHGK